MSHYQVLKNNLNESAHHKRRKLTSGSSGSFNQITHHYNTTQQTPKAANQNKLCNTLESFASNKQKDSDSAASPPPKSSIKETVSHAI